MRVIAKGTLRKFWEKHPDAEEPLRAWYGEVKDEKWATPHDLAAKYPKARILSDNRAIFDIRNNQFRLVIRINYQYAQVYIRFIGTHAQYDLINAKEV